MSEITTIPLVNKAAEERGWNQGKRKQVRLVRLVLSRTGLHFQTIIQCVFDKGKL